MVHVFVFEVGVGVLRLHLRLVEDCLPVLDLPDHQLRLEHFVVQLRVAIVNRLSSHISLEQSSTELNRAGYLWVVLELGLLDIEFCSLYLAEDVVLLA